jgi:cytosine/adenosine deaminase-related metal-dependent hydrolase
MTEPEPQPDAPSAVSPPEPAITLTSRLKQDASENIDLNMATVYAHCTIITMNKNRDIILDGAIVVFKDRITCVVKWEVVRSVIVKDTVPDGYTLVDCTGRILMPGLINTHAHLAQSLLRGLAEGMSLRNWLCDAIWPLEAQYGGDDGYVAARLTIAEMLKSGTTCFLESMLTHHSGFDNVARAVEESGIRACLVRPVLGFLIGLR